jgi:hypothetical protein
MTPSLKRFVTFVGLLVVVAMLWSALVPILHP